MSENTVDKLHKILYNITYKEKGAGFVLAVNYSTVRDRLKEYCDRVTDDRETVIVTRKGAKNVVIISLDEYNSLTKSMRNAAYLSKIDRAIEQLSNGEGKPHELIEVDDE